jgi:CRP/FNR family transcriptional regulator, cyclic AMP receptor protein
VRSSLVVGNRKKGTAHALTDSGFRDPREEACRFARGEASSPGSCTNRRTGGLLFLRSGTVEVVKDGVQIASVNAPGSVFGEQAVFLDQPHTADVRTLEQSEFYVADAPAILAGDPTVALYVAAILARRLDTANRWLVAVKRQLQTGEPPSVIGKAVEKVEELLSYGGRDPTGW